MKLYIMRHGETDWNKAWLLQGATDIPLNEFGIQLAKETSEGMKDIHFDLCISSPLCRAMKTAEIILGTRNVPMIIDPRIMEMDFGVWEGKHCIGEENELPESFDLFFKDPAGFIPPEKGESFAQVRERAEDFLTELFHNEDYQDKTILVSTHGATMKALMNAIKGESLAEFWGSEIYKNCAVAEVDVTDGKPTIISENEIYYKAETLELHLD